MSFSHVLISCLGMLWYLKSWFLWCTNLTICVNARKCLLPTEVLCPLPHSPCLGPAQALQRQPYPPVSLTWADWAPQSGDSSGPESWGWGFLCALTCSGVLMVA